MLNLKTALPMKRFFLFFVLLWIFVSCGKSDNQQDNRFYDNWKYIGYRDKALKFHSPSSYVADCKSCYTVHFKNDDFFDIQICSNKGGGKYQIDTQRHLLFSQGYGLTEIYDPMCPDEEGFSISGNYRFISDTLAISPNDTLTSLFVKAATYIPHVDPPRYYKRGILNVAPQGSYDCSAVSHTLVLEDYSGTLSIAYDQTLDLSSYEGKPVSIWGYFTPKFKNCPETFHIERIVTLY